VQGNPVFPGLKAALAEDAVRRVVVSGALGQKQGFLQGNLRERASFRLVYKHVIQRFPVQSWAEPGNTLVLRSVLFGVDTKSSP
jgi:hypothetical protein